MKQTRTIQKLFQGRPTREGAGVHLKRVFGNNEVPLFDPFLLLDDFRNDNPDHYLAGFPWHPHRGIETITYVLCGDVEHGDSMGNKGTISDGCTQWMTAGSGIIHQEMPRGNYEGKMEGFQLWANLPKSHKMMPPRYRDIRSKDVPEVLLDSGVRIKVIAGTVNGIQGPVKDVVIDPEYLDVAMPAGVTFSHETPKGHTVFAYVIGGQGYFDEKKEKLIGNGTACLFNDGHSVQIATGKDGVRFLLISGKPIGEPVAWYGPIVMNTEEELEAAFEEYRNGTFIKQGK